MNIADVRGKCKSLAGKIPRDVLVVAVLVLASLASFGLGYLSGVEAGQGAPLILEAPGMAKTDTSGGVVAAQNGSRYYFPNCAGVARLSEGNKIWFTSAVAAHEAGYTLANNCSAP